MKTHKFQLNQKVYFIKWGKVCEGIVDKIETETTQTLSVSGSIATMVEITYKIRGAFEFGSGKRKFLSFEQCVKENRLFDDRSKAEKELVKKADDSLRILLNSVYMPLSRIAALKKEEVVSDENYEWVKKAKKLASEIRAFNKERYHMRTPVTLVGHNDFMEH